MYSLVECAPSIEEKPQLPVHQQTMAGKKYPT